MDIKALLPELKKQVNKLSEDLLARVTTEKEIKSSFVEVFEQIKKSERTSQAFEVWLEDYLDQVAVAWVLSCVFVRFLLIVIGDYCSCLLQMVPASPCNN